MMKSKKMRLDQVLVKRGLVPSREKGVRHIMAGQVRVNGQVARKASQEVLDDDKIEMEAADRFVSRGGHKLQAALDHFQIKVQDRICLDIGSSTGGFTDCLLQAGARKVYCVDVGDKQLDWKLRSDPRVICREGVNARYLRREDFEDSIELITIDVSFISLEKILPAAVAVGRGDCKFVVLIKPQFEAGRRQVGKGGVVRDSQVHLDVVGRIRRFAEESLKLGWVGVIESPLKGPAGNKEFLAYLVHSKNIRADS